jgi:multidrug efflux pump subunit AcrA (membrane-fusion protein)
VTAKGYVWQVDLQADPVAPKFKVRVSVDNPPSAMRLGATRDGALGHLEVPASALTAFARHPAVWVVDPASLTVTLKPVEVLRFDLGGVIISGGLDGGHGGRSSAASGPEGQVARSAVMIGRNLSDWALKHWSFVVDAGTDSIFPRQRPPTFEESRSA